MEERKKSEKRERGEKERRREAKNICSPSFPDNSKKAKKNFTHKKKKVKGKNGLLFRGW